MWQVFPCLNCSDCLSHAQARTVTWLRVPQEKTSVPIVVKVPNGRQRKWLLGKPFWAKIPILDTEPSLHVQELLAPPYSSPQTACQDRLKSGGHGFKLYRYRRCWLHHCIRQKAARKNVDGLPTMPSLAFWKWTIISFMWHVFPCSNVRTVFRTHRQERWLDCMCLKKKLLFQLSWRKSPVAAKANGF